LDRENDRKDFLQQIYFSFRSNLQFPHRFAVRSKRADLVFDEFIERIFDWLIDGLRVIE